MSDLERTCIAGTLSIIVVILAILPGWIRSILPTLDKIPVGVIVETLPDHTFAVQEPHIKGVLRFKTPEQVIQYTDALSNSEM